MTRLRARVAERLKGAQNTYAMLTTFNEIDMTKLMQLRTVYKVGPSDTGRFGNHHVVGKTMQCNAFVNLTHLARAGCTHKRNCD